MVTGRRQGRRGVTGALLILGLAAVAAFIVLLDDIRDMFAAQPGIRALVVVGASHKPYLESYLNQMHDMTVVDAEAVLR